MKKRAIVIAFVLAICASGFAMCKYGLRPGPFAMRAPGPEGVPIQAPPLEGVTVQTFCPEVEQYPGEYSRLTLEANQRIMTALGWQVEDRNRHCDATLNLTLLTESSHLGANPDLRLVNYVQHFEMHVEATFTTPERELTLPVAKRFSFKTEGSQDVSATEMLWAGVLLDTLTYLWGPQVLVAGAKDENGQVRRAAAEALGDIGSEAVDAVPVLIQILEDEEWSVRKAAITALGNIGPEAAEAVPALVQELRDESDACDVAIMALGKIGPGATEAVPALIQILEDGHGRLHGRHEITAEALEGITGEDFGQDADRWQQWWDAR